MSYTPNGLVAMFEVLDAGSHLTLQDGGRSGSMCLGLPRGGAMDDLALGLANSLVGNPPGPTALEAALTGLRLKALRDVLIGLAGTEGVFTVGDRRCGGWRTVFCREGDVFAIRGVTQGVWTCIAVAGGFDAPMAFESASHLPEIGPADSIRQGQVLCAREDGVALPHEVAGRAVAFSARRQPHEVVHLRLWPGPHRRQVGGRAMAVLLSATWTVSPRRDRVGYRLNGQAMQVGFAPAFPEPIPVGAVQIGPEGLPVVAMRDAPTLGGYPVVGVLEPNDVGRLAQCRSGQKVAFVWAGRRP